VEADFKFTVAGRGEDGVSRNVNSESPLCASHTISLAISNTKYHVLTKGFSPKAIGTKAGTNIAGLVRSLSPRQPRAWCGAYLPASLGLGAVPISP
jgi:hypothetical protein